MLPKYKKISLIKYLQNKSLKKKLIYEILMKYAYYFARVIAFLKIKRKINKLFYLFSLKPY